MSGHDSGKLRMWNVVTGVCERVLEGHTTILSALAVCGSRLMSACNWSIKVWAVGGTCERTILGHADCVSSLVGWQGKVVSGSLARIKNILVWDVGTGALDATLEGHDDAVLVLAVHGDRLFSASFDGTIRVWAMGTWAALRTVEAYGRGTGLHTLCLAVSGSRLVSGSCFPGFSGFLRAEMQAWDLETLDLLHTLRLSSFDGVKALLAVDGGMWAGVSRDVVVWGSAE